MYKIFADTASKYLLPREIRPEGFCGNFDEKRGSTSSGSFKENFWTWYQPPNGRKIKNFVESLELLIDRVESQYPHLQRIPHLVMIGDSTMNLLYTASQCSVQRTLGARIISNSAKGFNKLSFKIGVEPANLQSIFEYKVEINSTKLKRMRYVKISLVRNFITNYDPIYKKYDDYVLKSVCGIPFTTHKYKQTVQIIGNKTVDLVLINYGLHLPSRTDYREKVIPVLDTALECEKRGTQVIFLDSYAQHFRFMLHGSYKPSELDFEKNKLQDIPRNAQPFSNTSTCAPIVFEKVNLTNWRYYLIRDRLSKIDYDNDILCGKKPDLVDNLPIYALTAPYWYNHVNKDCTHQRYQTGIYIPIFETAYKAVLRYNWKDTKCIDIGSHNDGISYYQGPEGIVIGKKENHSNNFLPTHILPAVYGDIKFNESALASILN